MQFSLNPFKLRKQAAYWATKFSKQALEMINLKEQIAQLQTKCGKLTQNNKRLTTELEKYKDQVTQLTVNLQNANSRKNFRTRKNKK